LGLELRFLKEPDLVAGQATIYRQRQAHMTFLWNRQGKARARIVFMLMTNL
jgi:hypothetical protein